MTPLWTRDEVVAATGGRSGTEDWAASGICTDVATCAGGDLFVALPGGGAPAVTAAFAAGAAAAIISDDEAVADGPTVVVADTAQSLTALAEAARRRAKAAVIGITGSVGKTSTKDMLAAVLAKQGKTHVAATSQSRPGDLDLTFAALPPDAPFCVIDIAGQARGETGKLARRAGLDVAIVTTIAPAMLDRFEDTDSLAEEMAAIFTGLKSGGTAIFNADVDAAPILNVEAKQRAGRRIGFGEHADATLRATRITQTDAASVIEGRFSGQPFLLKVSAPGRHFAMNALAVYGAATVVGADPDVAACDLALWRAPAGRGQRERLVLDPVEDFGIVLIDDVFNANPASMGAAFEVLAAIQPEQGHGRIATGRRIAILGDMWGLGGTEIDLHRDLAAHPAVAAFTRFDCVGPRMRSFYEALPAAQRGRWEPKAEALARDAHRLVDAGDVVLVKGSEESEVRRVANALRALDRRDDRGTE